MSTAEDLLYLRPDVYCEPLVNQWYAWPYLIPPAPAARHFTNTHLRIMKSFVNNHELHILASQDAALAGGDFLNCSADQVELVRDLIDSCRADNPELIELSAAVGQLDDLLRAHTSGESLKDLYDAIPAPLKGYVELCFDMNHNPSWRAIEPLLYKSRYYKPGLQSISLGLLSEIGERPFVLSTPRFADQHHLHLKLDFASPVVDRIFRAREIPLTRAEVDKIFQTWTSAGGLDYRKLFTTEPDARRSPPLKSGVRAQYLGHAGFMIETPTTTVLVDPVIASRGATNADDIVSFSELPARIDYVCLTHNHLDHVNIETLLQLRYKIGKILVPKNNGGTIVDPSIRLMLKQLGFDAIEVDDLEEIAFDGGRILSVPFLGEHGDINIRSKTAWSIGAEGRELLFTADSCNLDPDLYRHLHDIIGSLDVLAIGMECVGAPFTWLYGALFTKKIEKNVKQSRRLNGSDSEQALAITRILEPREVFVYALGQEPWYKYFMGLEYDDDSRQLTEARKFVEQCRQADIEASTLYGRKTIHLARAAASATGNAELVA